jgi:hypothetical protein
LITHDRFVTNSVPVDYKWPIRTHHMDQ